MTSNLGEEFGKERVRGQAAATWSECSIRRIIIYDELTRLFILIERDVGWTVKKEVFQKRIPKRWGWKCGFLGCVAKDFTVNIGLCKLLFMCSNRTIKTSFTLTFFCCTIKIITVVYLSKPCIYVQLSSPSLLWRASWNVLYTLSILLLHH